MWEPKNYGTSKRVPYKIGQERDKVTINVGGALNRPDESNQSTKG